MKKILEKIRSSKTFLVTTHMNMEGDALGSMLAMYWVLKALGKQVVMCNQDLVPEVYSFLPGWDKVKTTVKEKKFDAAIVLDCSDSSRTGNIKDYLGRAKSIINIDHHISNTSFGDFNLVDAKASSACQILFKLCQRLGVMSDDIALCLYTGIFTDTGNFTYANTSRKTHQVISRLLEYKVNPDLIDESLKSLCVPGDLDFIGKIMSSLKYDETKKICWAVINQWQEKSYDLTEVIFSIMRLLKGVEVFLLFKKTQENKVRVNFRSRHYVDVNKIAQFFGGGGHKRASGTTMEESIKSAEQKVIQFVKRYITANKV